MITPGEFCKKFNCEIHIPEWIIWFQTISFVVLYFVWALPHIVGFRNSALVIGSIFGLYPIYQARFYFFQRRAIAFWLIAGLFCWATFHLIFFGQEPQAQFLEFKRIWKYAAIGAIFAIGLGISLLSTKSKTHLFWPLIYFGLAGPVFLYLIKYFFTTYSANIGLAIPASLNIYNPIFYIPKTDYVAFCLPLLAVALARIRMLLLTPVQGFLRGCGYLYIHLAVLMATIFLFYKQDIRNGIAYAILLSVVFLFSVIFRRQSSVNAFQKILIMVFILSVLSYALYAQTQKNSSWNTLIADSKVALDLDQFQQWKYGGTQGYPINEFGKPVSPSNYERVAWFKVGVILANQNPLGYGLVEDSFKRMARINWPEVGPNLSHSHSGWLDFILAMGLPGFALLIGALIWVMCQSGGINEPWRDLVLWGLLANLLLWCTTEVSATVTLPALIFWASWGAGFVLIGKNLDKNN